MSNKIPKALIFFIALIAIIMVFVYHNIIIVTEGDYFDINSIGIIDDSLCVAQYDNIIYMGELNDDGQSHGAEILDYLKDIGYNNSIFYYSAEKNGVIDSESILEGLSWMKQVGVERINISLSSKRRNINIEEWILANPEITVFCSYNNKINTFDFPAKYFGTVSSGANNNMDYKENDVKYRSNRIIVINKRVRYYKGNSFLSITTMLNYKGWN